MPHLYTLDRKDLRGRVFPWSRAKAVARGRAWDLSCAQKGHQNLEWVADKVFHPACSMSDCLPSGLWLLVLWLWHVWTRSVFGKRSFLSRYQLTGLWHYCCPLLGSFFCAGNAFFHACFSGLGLFKSTLEKAAGPKSECPEKNIGFETRCKFKVWLDYRLCEGNEALKPISVGELSQIWKR